MQRIKKTARIAALEGKPVRDEVRRGVRAYRATEHATTGVSPNKLMFGRELRGKFPDVKRQPKHPDDTVIRHNDKKRKLKMKQYADKRRHTAVMKIKVGDTVLCKQERKHSSTPLYDPDPMVVIGVKGSMITAKNDVKIRTRNYADWKLLKNGCRESVQCDDSDSEDAFEPDAVTVDRAGSEQPGSDRGENAVPTDRIREPQHGQQQPRAHPRSDHDSDREQRHAARDRPRRKITSTKDTRYKNFVCE